MRIHVRVFGCALLLGLASCTVYRPAGERPAEARVADQPGHPDLDGWWDDYLDIHQENGRWVVIAEDDLSMRHASYVRVSGTHIEFEFEDKVFYSLELSADGKSLTGYWEADIWEGHRNTGRRERGYRTLLRGE